MHAYCCKFTVQMKNAAPLYTILRYRLETGSGVQTSSWSVATFGKKNKNLKTGINPNSGLGMSTGTRSQIYYPIPGS